MRGLSRKNHAASDGPFFVGAGAYRHHVPAAVDHIIQRSEFLTSYTPYQPEIAQGTLQYLFEFQTQVANLTGMEVANASMYDGSTATGEAVLMAHRVTRRQKAVLSGGLHPHYREVVETLSRMAGDQVVALDPDPRATEDILASIDDETSCVVVQSPSFYGQLIDLAPIAEKAHAHGALLVAVFTEVVSLGLARTARRTGRGHRRRRRPGDRQCAEFRRALCRPLRDQAEISPPDARPALRHDGRRGGQARLRADALDPRAAYPPREGDLEHLHQLRALLPRLHRAHDAARRDGAAAARGSEPRPRLSARGCAGKSAGRRGAEQGVLQRVHGEAAEAGGAGRRGARGEGHHGWRAGVAASARRPNSRTSSSLRRRR